MKNEKNRKLHGSVLLTVVVVMSLLIVFLFGTLTLATAANNRAHVNYSSSQTGITSRMVAQSAVEAMDASLAYRQVIGNIKSTSAPVSVNVTVGNATSFNSGALGDIAPVQVEYAGTKRVYDYDEKKWKDNIMLKFTSSVTMGGVESKSSAYVVKLQATNTPPGKGKGAGFVTTAGATFNCQTSLYGGAYIMLPDMNGTNAADYNYYVPKTDGSIPKPNFTDTPTKFEQQGAVAEANVYVNNNVEIGNWSGFIFPDKGTGITVWGDLTYSQNVNDSKKCEFSANSNIDYSNLKFNEIPYLYVDGKIKYGKAFKAGDTINPSTPSFPFNVFCGSFEHIAGEEDAHNFTCAANIYCMDPNVESSFVSLNSSKLFSWTNSVINQAVSSIAQPNKGSIFSKGHLRLKNFEINGDVSCEGNCTIEGNKVVIHGNLYVGEKLTVNGELYVDGEIICKTCENEDKIKKGEPTLSEKKTTIKSGYERINTYSHVGKANAVKVENKEIPYLVLDPSNYIHYNEDGVSDGYMDIFGNYIGSDPTIRVYKWRTDLSYEQISGIIASRDSAAQMVNDNLTNPDFDIKQCWRDYYDAAAALVNPDQNDWFADTDYPDGKTTYRVKSYYNKDNPTEQYYGTDPTSEEFSYYDPETGVEVSNDEPYKTLPEWNILTNAYYDSNKTTELDYVYFTTTDHQIVPEAEAVKVTDYYPNYAEREVLLGLEQVDTPDGKGKIETSETQVIKTLKDVSEKVQNPYESKGLPTIYESSYKGLTEYNLSTELQAFMGATGSTYIKSVKGPNASDPYVIETQTEEKDNKGICINSSCKLTGAYGDGSHDIVIKPNSKDILIVFDGFTINAGCNVYIDDSMGGNVTFFIEKDTDLKFAGQSVLATTSYMNLLQHYDNKELQYTHDTSKVVAGVPNIADNINDGSFAWAKERVKPSLDIYAGENASMTFANFQLMTANILSPDLNFVVSATSNPPYCPTKFYYNGINVFNPINDNATYKQFIYGCVNTCNATFPNQINIVYATDNSSAVPTTPPGTGDFDYTVLYYDEY